MGYGSISRHPIWVSTCSILGTRFRGLAPKEATLDSGCKDEPFHPCNSERVGSKMAPHMGNIVFIYSYYLLLHRDSWDSDPENSGNHKLWLYCYTHHAHSCIYRNRSISGYILVFLKIEVLYTKPLVSPPAVSQPSPSC